MDPSSVSHKKEIDAKLDEIVDFAELEDAIDAPVRTYSSGMQVRLGFSVASSLQPDILLLDEVLAVGDIGFVVKCLNRIRELSQDCAVIFVSHNLQFISSFCTRVIVMDQGIELLDAPNPAKGIEKYLSLISVEQTDTGTGQAAIKSIHLEGRMGRLDKEQPMIEQGEPCSLYLEIELEESLNEATLQIYIMDDASTPVFYIPARNSHGNPAVVSAGRSLLELDLGPLELCAGNYSFVIALIDPASEKFLIRSQGLYPFQISSNEVNWGKIVRPAILRSSE